MTIPVANTPLQAWQKAHGAQFADYGTWRLAPVYSSVTEELAAARTGLALADLALSKISLQGKGVKDLMRSWLGETKPGRVFPLEEGKSGWICVLSEDHCLLLSADPGSPNIIKDMGKMLPGFTPELASYMTSGHACLGLFGPEHGNILRQLTSLDVGLTGLPPASCSQTALAGVPALLVALPGSWSGTWIFLNGDLAEYVWERLWQIGLKAGMVALGMDAYRALMTSPER